MRTLSNEAAPTFARRALHAPRTLVRRRGGGRSRDPACRACAMLNGSSFDGQRQTAGLQSTSCGPWRRAKFFACVRRWPFSGGHELRARSGPTTQRSDRRLGPAGRSVRERLLPTLVHGSGHRRTPRTAAAGQHSATSSARWVRVSGDSVTRPSAPGCTVPPFSTASRSSSVKECAERHLTQDVCLEMELTSGESVFDE